MKERRFSARTEGIRNNLKYAGLHFSLVSSSFVSCSVIKHFWKREESTHIIICSVSNKAKSLIFKFLSVIITIQITPVCSPHCAPSNKRCRVAVSLTFLVSEVTF
jgi:Na+(H+)/acetate symporter ActP